ncbi:l-iditol 2-dehydrogenase [Fusarium heterosporum]|uniref:L-iditol 2-dehydrogenase n=1 Tax=Fusarium heterosporum TaxID=42747 RepID=A0A8H5TVI7_FUSHE|nr:l-iditol 2-dehydrogenase [Fusarium heterosporum]
MAPAATGEMAPMHLPVGPSKPLNISASVLHGPRDLRLETRTIEAPAAGELQIAIKTTGICGSDVSYYKKFANGDLCACQPLSLGHESSGEVVAIGPQVNGFKLGDRVALEVCTSVPVLESGSDKYRLPDNVSYDAAALLEPLSVAIHAVNRARPEPGSTALVIGAGAVGLLTAAMARQAGCTSVTITDIDAGRVNYAVSRGFATHGFVTPLSRLNSSSYSSGISTPDTGAITPASTFSAASRFDGAKSLAADILASSNPAGAFLLEEDEDGVDVTFECTGKEICMHTSLYATKAGGKLIMVGMGTPIQTLPLSVAHLREIDILGVFRYSNTYPTGIRLLCSQAANPSSCGLPTLDDMVTHRFKGLDKAQSAFELASRTSDDEGNLVLKVVIEA